MANLNSAPEVVVAIKRVYRKKDIYEVLVFENTRVDDIIDAKKRKPLIPHEYEILEIGVGLSFKEKYEKKYLK